jgi:hypothetical protein
MVGKYKAVQAILLKPNCNRIFFSCGNHTLNLIRVDSVEHEGGITIKQMQMFWQQSMEMNYSDENCSYFT